MLNGMKTVQHITWIWLMYWWCVIEEGSRALQYLQVNSSLFVPQAILGLLSEVHIVREGKHAKILTTHNSGNSV